MQQALNFLPDPQGKGRCDRPFLPTLRTGSRFFSVDRSLAAMAASCCWRMPPEVGAAASCGLGLLVDGLGPVELPPRAEVVEELGIELLDPEDQVGDLVADAGPHLGEDLHPFALVLDLGIDLGVAPQPDLAAEVVHGAEVFHPARVEDLEQDGLFHLAHFGPVDGVEGVCSVRRIWSDVMGRSVVGIDLPMPRDSRAHVDEVGQRGRIVRRLVLVDRHDRRA